MLIKIKTAALSFFLPFGIIAFIFLFVNYFSPQIGLKYLWAIMCGVLGISICGSIVFKTGVTPKSLWIRRSIMIGISCLISVLTVYLFDIIPVKSNLYILCVFVFTIVLAIVAYFIADKIEKHNLQKINDKLKQINNK